MRIYADFEYYQNFFKGDRITESAFDRLSLRASMIMDAKTFGQIDDDAAQTDAVRMACCALCDLLYAQEQDASITEAGNFVQSETSGKHSVSYAVSTANTAQTQIADLLSLYLGNTGLMCGALPYRTVSLR